MLRGVKMNFSEKKMLNVKSSQVHFSSFSSGQILTLFLERIRSPDVEIIRELQLIT